MTVPASPICSPTKCRVRLSCAYLACVSFVSRFLRQERGAYAPMLSRPNSPGSPSYVHTLLFILDTLWASLGASLGASLCASLCASSPLGHFRPSPSRSANERPPRNAEGCRRRPLGRSRGRHDPRFDPRQGKARPRRLAARASRRTRTPRRPARNRKREPRPPQLSRPGLQRGHRPRRDRPERPRKPRLVHAVHALPGRDFPGSTRSAPQLPDHGRRPNRTAPGKRLTPR